MTALLIGADPEVLLFNSKAGKYIPALRLFGGTKGNPRWLTDEVNIQEDGVAAELGFVPAIDMVEFVKRVNKGVGLLTKLAHGHGLELRYVSEAEYDPEDLNYPELQQAGCSSDFNIHLMVKNQAPDISLSPMRYAGGHIHLGHPTLVSETERQLRTIQALDIMLGLLEYIVVPSSGRRKFYGRAGDYRPKPYGIEYRTPSNWWLEKNEYIKTVYMSAKLAFSRPNEILNVIPPSAAQSIINGGEPYGTETRPYAISALKQAHRSLDYRCPIKY